VHTNGTVATALLLTEGEQQVLGRLASLAGQPAEELRGGQPPRLQLVDAAALAAVLQSEEELEQLRKGGHGETIDASRAILEACSLL
jgi:hypothetical protein